MESAEEHTAIARKKFEERGKLLRYDLTVNSGGFYANRRTWTAYQGFLAGFFAGFETCETTRKEQP